MNIFGFRPFKGKFNLGNSDDIPNNNDGTLIGAIKQINTHLTASNDAPFRFAYNSSTQEYGYIIDEGGADTFVPFKSGSYEDFTGSISYGTSIAVTEGHIYLVTYTYQIPGGTISSPSKGLSTGGRVLKDFGYKNQLVYQGYYLVGIHCMLIEATSNRLTFTYNDATTNCNTITLIEVAA